VVDQNLRNPNYMINITLTAPTGSLQNIQGHTRLRPNPYPDPELNPNPKALTLSLTLNFSF